MYQFMDKLVAKASSRLSTQPRVSRTKAKAKLTPDITISRDPGSGGKLIAAQVAKQLGWKFLDKELMGTLSRELGIPENEFADIDEHTRNWVVDSVHSMLNPNYVSDLHYLAHLRRLLVYAARDSDIVVLGRGANHILSPEKTLRVRITASFEKRVANTVKHEHKSHEDAVEWVKHVERKRVNFVRQYFGLNPYNPWHYDLIVNTDYLTLEQARDIILEAYFSKFPSERKRLGKKLK